MPHGGGLRRELGLADLALFNTVAALGVQWIAASAHVGPIAIPLHGLAALLFFVPSAFAVATLARRIPGEGGFYGWVRHTFGEWHGFLCAWCWWISVLLYLPGLLMAGAGMAAYVAGPALAAEARFLVPFTLLLLWAVVGANIAGLRTGKWLNNAGAALTYAGGALVLAAAAVLFTREGSATAWRVDGGFTWEGVAFWAQIAFAYTGLELGTLLGGEVRDPSRTIPRAAWISAGAVTGAYVLGAISLMVVLPPERIHPMTGLVQAAASAGERLGLAWLGVLAGVLLFAGILGKLSTWAGGAARLPYAIGVAGVFPAAFARVHPRWRTPYIALLAQGAACSAFVLVAQAGETLRAGWLVLIDMAVIAGFLPFVYIFLAAWRWGLRWSAASGLGVTAAALCLSLVPPADTASVWLFEAKLLGGTALIYVSGRAAFRRRRAA